MTIAPQPGLKGDNVGLLWLVQAAELFTILGSHLPSRSFRLYSVYNNADFYFLP